MRFQNLLWLFPLAISLHNLEEAIWLPEWSRRAGRWHAPVVPGVFRFAVTILTAVALVLAWLSFRSGRQSIWTYMAFGYMVAMLLNVLIPHLAATVALRRYMPGLATALALNLPVLSLLAILALRENYVSGWKAIEYSLGMTVLLLLSIPVLFRLGKALRL